MKPKTEGEDDSDWESDIEEDFPHVQLAELLDNLKLDENPLNNEEDDEENDGQLDPGVIDETKEEYEEEKKA